MMRLSQLFEGIEILEISGDRELRAGAPAIDSRKISAGGVFIAVRGTLADGHKFIENAVQKGAIAVVCEQLPDEPSADITWVRVEDSARASGIMAHNYYARPSCDLHLIGVTGTNGKTTTATLLHELVTALGDKAGLLSTVECRIGTEIYAATHTTPDSISLNRMLAAMRDSGCDCAFMEVSSHAIDQQRIAGLRFAGGVFTNITHDHLDYHGTFRNYLDTKKKFFDGLGTQAFALVNADDSHGEYMVQNTSSKVSKYSMHKLADFKGNLLGNGLDGLHMRVQDVEMMSPLVGEFNAYNLLAVYSTAALMGYENEKILTALSALRPAEGRFDVVRNPETGMNAIVDYAHTPDALDKVLSTLHQVVRKKGQVIVVVGCGGDRDRDKRPKMGAIASNKAALAILTSDNPRSEDPDEILREMVSGVDNERRKYVLVIADRKEAIRTAIRFAAPGDAVLIAGKGHEKYQEVKGEKRPFDDKKIVRDALFKDI